MGHFAASSLPAAIFLLAGYLIYKWLMSSEKQMGLNRTTILGLYAISFTAKPLADFMATITSAGQGGDIAAGALGVVSVSESAGTAPAWPIVLSLVYLAGVVAVAAWSVIVVLRLMSIIRSGKHIANHGFTLVLLSSDNVAPFSWGRYVVMGQKDYQTTGNLIIEHELAHISHRHCIDLLAAQLVCILQWFNPAAWLLREELKCVHEFQADDCVLSQGADARQYQLLLIKKAVGIRFQSIANSLNHSNLKKRITMMYNQKTSGRRRLRGLALVPALAAALAVTNLPAVASVLSSTNAASVTSFVNKHASENALKVTENEQKSQVAYMKNVPDRHAQFPGGQDEMFRFIIKNIKFPEELMKNNISGRVVVQFTVEKDGSLDNFEFVKSLSKEADAEALRVLKSMPAWQPAIVDGKPCAVSYTIPFEFKLPSDDKDNKK